MRGARFVDTSFYVALVSPSDERHTLALHFGEDAGRRSVTTEFVLMEVASYLTSRKQGRLFLTLAESIAASRSIFVVPASHSLFAKGVELLRQRPDKGWSLTDCTSFVVMERMRLSEALTADHHFQQAGFKAMLA